MHSLVDKLKWFYENARCYNKIYSSRICFIKSYPLWGNVKRMYNESGYSWQCNAVQERCTFHAGLLSQELIIRNNFLIFDSYKGYAETSQLYFCTRSATIVLYNDRNVRKMQRHNCTNPATHMTRTMVGHYLRLCKIYDMLAIRRSRKLPNSKHLSVTLLRMQRSSHNMYGENEWCV